MGRRKSPTEKHRVVATTLPPEQEERIKRLAGSDLGGVARVLREAVAFYLLHHPVESSNGAPVKRRASSSRGVGSQVDGRPTKALLQIVKEEVERQVEARLPQKRREGDSSHLRPLALTLVRNSSTAQSAEIIKKAEDAQTVKGTAAA